MSVDLAGQENTFFERIRAILTEARGRAYSSINHIMVETYWKIGQRIVEEEQGGQAKAAYGDQLIKELSKRLGDEFGKGFSIANLKNFRQFTVRPSTRPRRAVASSTIFAICRHSSKLF